MPVSFSLFDQIIKTSHLADGNVTTIKILDANVTTPKIADINVTGPKLDQKSYPARVTRSATPQVLTAGTYIKIQFNVEDYDGDSCFDSATYFRYTVAKAGKYRIQSSIKVIGSDPGTNGNSLIAIYKNGSAFGLPIGFPYHTSIDPAEQYLKINNVLNLALNDYIEIFVNAYLTSPNAEYMSSLEIHRIFD